MWGDVKRSDLSSRLKCHLGATPVLVVLAMVAFFSSDIVSAAQDFKITAAQPWVKKETPPRKVSIATDSISDGVLIALYDVQVNIKSAAETRFVHIVKRVMNPSGAQSAARVSVTFDPSYQVLTLHDIAIFRDGSRASQLKAAAVKVMQREKELEYQIYDGAKTAEVILEDVRVGDVIEYSYSLEGRNPVFGRHYFGGIELQWGVPVQELRQRVRLAKGTKLFLKNHNTDVEPLIVHYENGETEYLWAASDVPALSQDKDTPEWYDPYPWVQLSDMVTWHDVATWAMPLYQAPRELSPQLTELIHQISDESADPEQRTLRVLRFIQDNIRYLGIEMGASSHAPNAPDIVLQRRFGDCKDKALLMVTMLNAMGVDAAPALVHTRMRQAVANLNPTANAFNHVLVRVEIQGHTYWLDPTRQYQRGQLDTISQADYGVALVITSSSTKLISMQAKKGDVPLKRIDDTFDLREGNGESVAYNVKTTYSGYMADGVRARLASASRAEVQKDDLNYFARFYPAITVRAPLEVDDDERWNLVTVTEHYTIASLWQLGEDNIRRASFYPVDLFDYTRKPSNSVRNMPLGIGQPIDVAQDTTVHLNPEWKLKNSKMDVADAAFSFSRAASYANSTLNIAYRYRSLSDHVDAPAVANYLGNLQRMEDSLGYGLIDRQAVLGGENALSNINWMLIVVVVFAAAGFSALARWLYTYDPPRRIPTAPYDPALTGIAGWLLLPAFGLIVAPLASIWVGRDLGSLFDLRVWNALLDPTSEHYSALTVPYMLYAGLNVVGRVVLMVLLMLLFFKRRSSFPAVYCAFLMVTMVDDFGAIVVGKSIPLIAKQLGDHPFSQLVFEAIRAAIWIAYFRVSKRVKFTFTRRRNAPATVDTATPTLTASSVVSDADPTRNVA